MTETESRPATKPHEKSGASARAAGYIVLTLALGVALALVAVVQFQPGYLQGQKARVEIDLAPLGGKIVTLEEKVAALETKVGELSAGSGRDAGAGDPATLARMQGDIGALQGQMKQINETAAVTLNAARTSLAATLIFMQMRQEAEAGRSFSNLLATMRGFADGDATLLDLLVALEPYAGTGAPALPALQMQFASLVVPAAQEFDREAARTWWERILAELKGLVSVRPLRGGDSIGSVLAAAEEALAQNDLAAAIDRVDALPPGTQEVLEKWRKEAEARQKVDAALQAIAARLRVVAQSALPAAAPMPARASPALSSPPSQVPAQEAAP